MRASLLLLALNLLVMPAWAEGALRVSPVTLSLSAPQMATTLTLENPGDVPANVQVRVFRWTQQNGVDRLEPTRSTVVSPPIMTLAPGARQTVRVIRIAKDPIQGVESDRILVDQLPEAPTGAGGRVAFVVRQSIPVFFNGAAVRASPVRWTVRLGAHDVILEAANPGDLPVRIATPAIETGGNTIPLSDGLVGYVLGGSTMQWRLARPPGLASGSDVLAYRDLTGAVRVPITVRSGG